jgi:predicted secreted protein
MTRPRNLVLAFGFICVLTLSQNAMAGDGNGLNLPPEGTTIINLSATEKRTLPQDLLVASLRIEAEDKSDPAVVQKKINEAMTKALELAKKESSFKISTGAYSVYKNEYAVVVNPKTGEQKTEKKWMGSQTIDIQSKDSTKLLEIVGKIQGLGFAMNNLAYTLSPEVMETTRDELLVNALKKLVAKADIVAKTLGKSKADLVDVNVDAGGPVMPMYKNMMGRAEMVMAADAAMPAPVAEAGESDVQLTVSARALIK